MSTPDRAPDAPRQVTTLRFSPQERATAEQAARVNGQTLSAFVRDATLSAAGDCLESVPGAGGSRVASGVIRPR